MYLKYLVQDLSDVPEELRSKISKLKLPSPSAFNDCMIACWPNFEFSKTTNSLYRNCAYIKSIRNFKPLSIISLYKKEPIALSIYSNCYGKNLVGVYVKPAFRNQGVGVRVLKRMKRELTDLSITDIFGMPNSLYGRKMFKRAKVNPP
jgi:GNAT superfamily N-acetyltransferase